MSWSRRAIRTLTSISGTESLGWYGFDEFRSLQFSLPSSLRGGTLTAVSYRIYYCKCWRVSADIPLISSPPSLYTYSASGVTKLLSSSAIPIEWGDECTLCTSSCVCAHWYTRVCALMKIKRASCTYRVLCFFGEILDRTPGVQDPEPETGKSWLKIIIADDLHVINFQTGRPNY